MQNPLQPAPGAAFDQVLGFHQLGEVSSTSHTINTGVGGLQTTSDGYMAPGALEEPFSPINQPVGPQDSSYYPLMSLQVSQMETYLENSFADANLRSSDMALLDTLPPAPDALLLSDDCFTGQINDGHNTRPIASQSGETRTNSLEGHGDEFDYVLGGIGGEVPLIQ
ncbi:hypothetical protein N7532_003997 [Penicillium argentinense]|uniref:Uncharacterized protein n=1 Tax=Penicillium argentinense TaxID=1131581 RepID=A0A9W9KF83_9EURO|nr:uncharacterized protein N7532_003997 [Penicillium argentinense]KAJ5103468.1 hypothetical protein N7532_003997 [Penicillium argentinense]